MVTGAEHWFRDWSLITGRGGGATNCLYGFVDLHKLFLATFPGIKMSYYQICFEKIE